MKTRLLFGLAAVCAAAVISSAWAKPAPKADRPLAVGTQSGVQSARQVVVRDDKAYAALWKEHAGANSTLKAPKVDFRKHDVLAVFAGTKPTSGYSVDITDVKLTRGLAIVHVTLQKPPKGMMLLQVITTPYVIRTCAKLPPRVQFVTNEIEAPAAK